MTTEEMKADQAKAAKSAEDHYKLHLQWLGVAQYLAQKLAEAEAQPKAP